MQRRTFLQATAATTGLALLGSIKFAATSFAAETPYGPLETADANGIQLPSGFSSRVVATTGAVVAASGYSWHPNPDGGAVFAQPDGGWVYVSNDESGSGAGGVGMIRFNTAAQIVDAGPILTGTSRNCAGGATPWGTWLSCEEFSGGQVWECDPLGIAPAMVRPAMGVFSHEAAAADPEQQVIYLTEDRADSGLYRFAPDTWGDLSSGELQVMTESSGSLGWATVPDPSASQTETRAQVASMKQFNGGEGAWFDGNLLYFTTKGDNRVWTYDPAANLLEVIYDRATSPDPVLSGVDNVTVSPSGDVFVCEDGGNMEIVMLTPEGTVAPFVRIGVSGSEVTGVAFDPSGTRMYFSSQRNPGVTFEVTGPFRTEPSTPDAIDVASVVVNGSSKRRGVNATSTVTIADANSAISGASVSGDWAVEGTVFASATGQTDASGAVTFTQSKIAMATDEVLTFTVTSLSAFSLSWDPALLPGEGSGSWANTSSGGGGNGGGNGGGGNGGGGNGGGKPPKGRN